MRHPSDEPDDETLVLRVLAGERRMFAPLLERHRESVLRLCRRLLGSETDAQDVVQEAALQAFLGLGRLREPGRFGAWLHSIAANLARSELRRRRKATPEPLQDHERRGALLIDASPTPEEVRLARELHDEVLAALDGLSDVNREAVIGYYLKGHSNAELAGLLGVPVSTVKGRLHKGRRRLATSLEPVAQQVLGKGLKKEETVVKVDGMVEVVVDDVLKKGPVDESFLEVLRSGSMEEYHEIGTRDYERLPAAVVILREVEGERVMPIFVGLVDGLSIWRSVSGWEPPRPFTHDLMRELLTTMNLAVESVAVVRLAERTFYGEISLRERDGGSDLRRVDSRPSDAIALAARLEAPIYVAQAVLDEAAFESKEALLEAQREGREPFRK
jgi:uncharacterized protein